MPSHRPAPTSSGRRRLLQGLTGACALLLGTPSRSDVAPAAVCTSGASTHPLLPARGRGYLGRLRMDGTPLRLRAGAAPALPPGIAHGKLAYRAQHSGTSFVNPTLVVRRGDTMRVTLDNALDRPTIVHWHGLTLDTRNDGSGSILAAPGERYEYAFEVRNRAGLYWYHPHPHGDTARQVHDGLFGLLEVEDDDEIALRRALDLAPGSTELTLVLQDRTPGEPYAATPEQGVHGYFGDAMYVNGIACAHLDVATRLYRLRLLNACNARTLLLGLRTAAGSAVPFQVIGTDGGLLDAPMRCDATFLAAAERIDLLVDLRDAGVGDALVLETRAFDPMHAELAPPQPSDAGASQAGDAHAHHRPAAGGDAHAGHGASAWPEGTSRDILVLRVRERVRYDRPVPARLSTVPALDVAGATERPLRLGYKSGRWRINDRVFAMGETPIEVARGTTEVWLLRNYFNSMPHAMHLHGFGFTVLERETSPDPVRKLALDDKGRLAGDLGRKDTVLVWPGESVRIGLRFDLPFPGAQTYVFHCHNLEHEDGGMMLGVKVSA